MTAHNKIIDTNYFNNPRSTDSGLILDYRDAINTLPRDAGKEYVSSHDYRLKPGAFLDKGAETQRAKIAEPHIIATFDPHDTANLPDITANGMIVKNRGSDYIALPDVFETALPKIHAAAMDVLKLYGKDRFVNAEFLVSLNRTDVEKGTSQRPSFAGWHDHVSNGETSDLAYLFSDYVGTEYQLTKHEGQLITNLKTEAPDSVITRMGGEISHRSQTVQQDIRREWGALVVLLEKPRANRNLNNRSYNNALVNRDETLFEEFNDNAMRSIARNSTTRVLDTPRTLIDFKGLDVECS